MDSPSPAPHVEELSPEAARREVPALAEILSLCVAGGASVNFVQPFPVAEAAAWWAAKLEAPGRRRVFAARVGGALRGTVTLEPAAQPNQRHRADVSKMLVHPAARRLGLGRALLRAAEDAARAEGRTLLTLDTEDGSPAQRLYESCGYVLLGVVPGYAMRADGTGRAGAAFYWKDLDSA